MLEVKNLKKSFGKINVLKGIDFKIEKGDRLAIIGPSGCGKSTLLRCLNLIEVPTSGEIFFEGRNLLDKSINLSSVRRKIGMVFQQFNLFGNLTVLDNIILAPVKLKIMSVDKAKAKAHKLLELIDLDDKCDCYPRELSGGQQQRVAIVRSLVMEPDIILFDEPTSALDPEMVGEVLSLIERIADDGMTMIIVSHEMNFVKSCANKILFIDEGVVSYFGSVDEAFHVKDNKRLKEFLEKSTK